MKNILGSISRHIVGALGAVLAWAATADVNAITDIAANVQLIVGALMTIGAAGSGIWSAIQAKKAKRLTAIASASYGTPAVKEANGRMDNSETGKAESVFYARSGS